MNKLILDEEEIKKAIIMYIGEKYNIWDEKQIVGISNSDCSSISDIEILIDKRIVKSK